MAVPLPLVVGNCTPFLVRLNRKELTLACLRTSTWHWAKCVSPFVLILYNLRIDSVHQATQLTGCLRRSRRIVGRSEQGRVSNTPKFKSFRRRLRQCLTDTDGDVVGWECPQAVRHIQLLSSNGRCPQMLFDVARGGKVTCRKLRNSLFAKL